ncbi:hypothetical protein CI102_14421 [Trichoderma harzianum]|nr:hypothetical protein CI102_14421 [Trichoderma harzianum]
MFPSPWEYSIFRDKSRAFRELLTSVIGEGWSLGHCPGKLGSSWPEPFSHWPPGESTFLSRKCTKAFGVLCTPCGYVKYMCWIALKPPQLLFCEQNPRTLSLPANGEQFTTIRTRRSRWHYKIRCLIYLRVATRLKSIMILSESIQIESWDYIDNIPN